MILFIIACSAWLSAGAMPSESTPYRRWIISCAADPRPRPPKYRDQRISLSSLELFIAADDQPGYLNGRYVIPRGEELVHVDLGWRSVDFEPADRFELMQRHRRHQALRAEVMANVELIDPTEPAFGENQTVARTVAIDSSCFRQLAVALPENFAHAHADPVPVEVHLIHDESGRYARLFSAGAARVRAVSAAERLMIENLRRLAECETRFRN